MVNELPRWKSLMARVDDNDIFALKANRVTSAGSRYEIVRELGRGGMATVFLAKDMLLERELAIKVLNAQLALDQSQVERFRNEAQACSSLDHPNIVKVLSHGENADGQPIIVMEYLLGKTLEESFKTREMSGREYLALVVAPVIEALVYAHERRIVHRDLKPSNIMLCQAPGETLQIKVLDFGIAKALEHDSKGGAAATVGITGSPFYMSPEQAAGAKADPRSDIYSLGCIMYEALAGRPPFVGETPLETMYEHLRASIPKLDDLQKVNQISDEVLELIGKCLAKDPEQRPASMLIVQASLNHALSSNKLSRRKSTVPPLVAFMALAALLAGFIVYFFQYQLRQTAELHTYVLKPKHMIVAGGRSAIALYSRAKNLIRAGKPLEATPLLETALKESARSKSVSELQVDIHNALAEVYESVGEDAKSRAEYKAVIDGYSGPDAFARRLDSIVTYARKLSRDGFKSEAEQLYRKTYKEAQEHFANNSLSVFGDFLFAYATFLFQTMHRPPEKCLGLAQKAMLVYDQTGNRASVHACEDTWLLYDIYKEIGQIDKGRAEMYKTARVLNDSEANATKRICGFAIDATARKEYAVAEKAFALAEEKSASTVITGEVGESAKVRKLCLEGIKKIELERRQAAAVN